jgi:Phage integrase family
VRHGLRHTALTWMADAGVELHLLQRVAGHQDPAVTSRYLHPDHQAVLDVGAAYSRWWAQYGPNSPALRLVEDGPVAVNAALIRCDNPTLTCRAGEI